MRLFTFIVIAVALLPGCTGNETNDNEKRSSANEETRFVTQMVTVEETVPSRTTEELAASE